MRFLGLAVALIRGRLLRVDVSGDSMEPAIRHGDRVLARRVSGVDVHIGQVIVAEVAVWSDTPELVVKRVVAVADGHVVLAGDNPAASRDSRHFGPVPFDRVIGVVVDGVVGDVSRSRDRRSAPAGH